MTFATGSAQQWGQQTHSSLLINLYPGLPAPCWYCPVFLLFLLFTVLLLILLCCCFVVVVVVAVVVIGVIVGIAPVVFSFKGKIRI